MEKTGKETPVILPDGKHRLLMVYDDSFWQVIVLEMDNAVESTDYYKNKAAAERKYDFYLKGGKVRRPKE